MVRAKALRRECTNREASVLEQAVIGDDVREVQNLAAGE